MKSSSVSLDIFFLFTFPCLVFTFFLILKQAYGLSLSNNASYIFVEKKSVTGHLGACL